MRLLQLSDRGHVTLTKDLVDDIPPYAILSHTWGDDEDEVIFKDIENGVGQEKSGYQKIVFCGEQARKDGISHFWVDTCCIDKSSHTELSEAIMSMFRWYREAVKCYVYLSDVSASPDDDSSRTQSGWEQEFRKSRWFTRGWTLQELLAPCVVEFYTYGKELLGDKSTLVRLIHEITDIPIDALGGMVLSHFPRKERMRWAVRRKTKKPEDKAYCLLGIFEVFMPLIYGEGDNALARLDKGITERYGSTVDAAHKYWLVPRSPHPLFTGRKVLLRELENTIRESVYASYPEGLCRIVISGIGGQGKSEICLQLACRLRHIFWAVLWIDISTTEMAERSLLEIARSLSLSAQTWQEARSSIANLKHPWLLVLDNADTPDVDYLEYFPDSPVGVVLMTTRNEECQQYASTRFVDLVGLDNDDACELLLKACHVSPNWYIQHQNDALKVTDLLQSHALALLQAGAYIARGHCSLSTYPYIYQQQRLRLIKFRPRQAQSRYQDVYTTFEVSAKILTSMQTEAAQDALQLLPLLAVGGPSRLPISLLFEAAQEGVRQASINSEVDSCNKCTLSLTLWHITELPPPAETNNNFYDFYRLVEAVCLLKALSLVSTDGVDRSLLVTLHPLVHAWAWERQSKEEQYRSWHRFGCLVALALELKKLISIDERQLQTHVEALIEWPVEIMFATKWPMSVAQILTECGYYLHKMRADDSLHLLLRKAFVGLKLGCCTVERTYIDLYELRARNILQYGEVQESLIILEQVVLIRKQLLAEDHLSRLTSQHTLAIAYKANGQIEEAVALLEEVVRIEQSLAVDHPDRLASQHELAGAYEANGQVKEAVSLLEEVVRIQGQSLAKDHSSQLTSQHALAGAYRANGQVKEAVTLLEEVVKIQQSLAEDHPSRLESQHSLAIAYEANGQVKEAVALLENVTSIEKQSLGKDHPSRLASQQALAMAYQSNGRVEEAMLLLEEVIEIRRRSQAEDHPAQVASEHALARAYRVNGQVTKAVALLEKVVRIRKQSLAEDHPDRLASQHELAGAYQSNGQVKEAVALLEQVLRIKQQSLVEDHPSRLISQFNLAVYLVECGEHERPLAMLQEVVSLSRRILNENHPHRRSYENTLAHLEYEIAVSR